LKNHYVLKIQFISDRFWGSETNIVWNQVLIDEH